MASLSNSPVAFHVGPPITEKLTRDNFLLGKAQILPAIKGARLLGILDGSSKAPTPTVKVQKSFPMRNTTHGWQEINSCCATSSTP
jgi:hypothetical protein